MSNLTLNKKQVIDNRYIYWFNRVLTAVEDRLGEPLPVAELKIEVIKLDNDYKVNLIKKSELQENEQRKLIFNIPENFDWHLHYMILVSWAADKLTKWQAQVK